MDAEGGTPQEQAVGWLEEIHRELQEIKQKLEPRSTSLWMDIIGSVVQGAVIAVVLLIIFRSK